MITALQSPIQQAEAILNSAYLSLEQVRLHSRCPKALAPGNMPTELILERAIRQAIAVHNEALLENVSTPDIDLLMQVIRDELIRLDGTIVVDRQLDSLLEQSRRMLKALLESEHAKSIGGETIIGIEHDVSGFIGSDLPPVRGRADLVSHTAHGVVVTNYRILESEAVDNIVEDHVGELHLIGALIAGSVDEHARLAGLRLVTISNESAPQVHRHHIPLDESRLRAMIDLVRSSWRSILDQHTT